MSAELLFPIPKAQSLREAVLAAFDSYGYTISQLLVECYQHPERAPGQTRYYGYTLVNESKAALVISVCYRDMNPDVLCLESAEEFLANLDLWELRFSP
jgi:hypothetical protein